MIYISQAAAKEIKRLKTMRQQPDNCFRLSVKEGGCSGLFYSLDLDNVPSETEAQTESGDRAWESNGLTVIVDRQTYPHVQALKLDYAEDLMGGGFRFQNPHATSTCKCGLSFTTNPI